MMHRGERAWTRLSALINRAAVPLKYSLAEAPKSFTSADLIAPRREDMARPYAKKDLQINVAE